MIWLMILLVPVLDAVELIHRAYDWLRDEPRDERPRPRPKPKPTYARVLPGIGKMVGQGIGGAALSALAGPQLAAGMFGRPLEAQFHPTIRQQQILGSQMLNMKPAARDEWLGKLSQGMNSAKG